MQSGDDTHDRQDGGTVLRSSLMRRDEPEGRRLGRGNAHDGDVGEEEG